jgi:hypothetical protein
MNEFLDRRSLETFICEASDAFPKCLGGVLVDKHGFVISSKIQSREFDENELALQAISNRKIVDMKNYIPVIKDLDENNRLMLIIERDNKNLSSYRKLNQVLRERNPFT